MVEVAIEVVEEEEEDRGEAEVGVEMEEEILKRPQQTNLRSAKLDLLTIVVVGLKQKAKTSSAVAGPCLSLTDTIR